MTGSIFMPFVTPLSQYTPESEIDQRSVADSKVLKKPAKIREEAENRNKQLLEGAFHGTLHLYVCVYPRISLNSSPVLFTLGSIFCGRLNMQEHISIHPKPNFG
jgi:hypothetical protein